MFTQFYACTVCAPIRASLMTGKMSNRMGMWDAYARTSTTFEKTKKPVPEGCHILDNEPWDEYNYSKTDRGVSVPIAATALHDVKTIPQGLKGYHSVFIGKWHIGSYHHEGYRPEDHGFDETLAYFDGGHPVYTRNTPLRGGKSMLYEGGVRVPMIVRWPGKTKAAMVCDVTSDIADIYPTLMEIGGVDYSDFKADKTTDGESLKPLFGDLENTTNAYTRNEFYQFYGKLGYKGFHDFATWATLRKGDYKLHYDYHGKVELYNIAEDMFEKNDLVKTKPKLAYDMLVQLTEWLKANCNEAYLPNPNFDPDGPLPYRRYVPLEELKASLMNGK